MRENIYFFAPLRFSHPQSPSSGIAPSAAAGAGTATAFGSTLETLSVIGPPLVLLNRHDTQVTGPSVQSSAV